MSEPLKVRISPKAMRREAKGYGLLVIGDWRLAMGYGLWAMGYGWVMRVAAVSAADWEPSICQSCW